MKFYFFLFSLFVVFCTAFDLSNEPKLPNPDDSLNLGKVYDFEEIKIKQIENATKKLELLKNNNLNLFFNKYFENIDTQLNFNKGFEYHNYHYAKLGYPYFYGLYSYVNANTKIQDYEKHEKIVQFFSSLSTDLSILYKNESMSLYHSKNEDFTKKLIELNIAPLNNGISLWDNGSEITLFETLLIFETKNIDFKELIKKKFKNTQNILFENYYVLIVF
jgi:hypothetical protein